MLNHTFPELANSTNSAPTFTAEPVAWLRVPDACRVASLSRSTLYLLMAEEKIKSCCIRRKGAIRGARRISAESLNAYLNSLSNSPA